MLKLRTERERRGWSKAELARRARVDQSFVSKVEARRQVPYPSQLKRLATALGVPVSKADTLLEDAD